MVNIFLKTLRKQAYVLFFNVLVASQQAAAENDMETARKRGRQAMWVALAGIVVTALTTIICVIIMMSAAVAYAHDALTQNFTIHSTNTTNIHEFHHESWN